MARLLIDRGGSSSTAIARPAGDRPSNIVSLIKYNMTHERTLTRAFLSLLSAYVERR